jgi:hypothetical protein
LLQRDGEMLFERATQKLRENTHLLFGQLVMMLNCLDNIVQDDA